MTSAEQSAAQAQRTLNPGSGKCVLCGEDVWRWYTSGDTAHLSMFDETDGGGFEWPEQGGGRVAPYVGKPHGSLAPHDCLQDAS
jgi:hypothetical protein